MTKHLFALVAILAASTLAFGCFESDDDDDGNGGGGNGNLDCSFEPCGGDLVGTWTAYGFCAAGSTGLEAFPACNDAVVDGSPDVEGSITFNADGTYSQDTAVSGHVRYEYDDDCVTQMLGGMMTAEAYCQMMQALVPASGGTLTGTCAYAGGWCKCNLTMNATDRASGTYTTANSTITLDGGSADPYCVAGNELRATNDDGAVSVFRK